MYSPVIRRVVREIDLATNVTHRNDNILTSLLILLEFLNPFNILFYYFNSSDEYTTPKNTTLWSLSLQQQDIQRCILDRTTSLEQLLNAKEYVPEKLWKEYVDKEKMFLLFDKVRKNRTTKQHFDLIDFDTVHSCDTKKILFSLGDKISTVIECCLIICMTLCVAYFCVSIITADITESFTLKLLDDYLPGILLYSTLIKAVLMVGYFTLHCLRMNNAATICICLLSFVFLITLANIGILFLILGGLVFQLKFCANMIDRKRIERLHQIRNKFIDQF